MSDYGPEFDFDSFGESDSEAIIDYDTPSTSSSSGQVYGGDPVLDNAVEEAVEQVDPVAVEEAVEQADPVAVEEAVEQAEQADPVAVEEAVEQVDPVAVEEAVEQADPVAVEEAVEQVKAGVKVALELASEVLKKRKVSVNVEEKASKRPASAFFVFMEDFRKTFKESFPDNKSVSVVAKAGGEKWKSLSESEKAPYAAKALTKKAEDEKAMEEFNKKLNDKEGEAKPEESEKSSSGVHSEAEQEASS